MEISAIVPAIHMSAPPASPFDPFSRRLAVYGYLAPLVVGRRVIEVGCGTGAGAARLQALGAADVLGVDTDPRAIARAGRGVAASSELGGLEFRALEPRALRGAGEFDLVVVPEAAALLGPSPMITAATLQALCGPGGQVALLVQSADAPGPAAGPGAAGYYEVVELLQQAFPRVRMFGLTPFAAFGLAEFAEAPSGLRIDGALVEEAGEHPTHYLAVAGPDEDFDLGYALMQIPAAADGGAAVPAIEARSTSSADVSDLRRRLAESEGKCEGLLRVSRAQTEEIEELRARLRRGAEAREELDQEMGRLRRSLTEVDASVLDLTRRTTQEMAALAQRITSGLRPEAPGPAAAAGRNDGVPVARLREELRRREEELAATESALSERDERVAVLEAEKQDLDWRLAAAAAAAAAVPAPTPAPARSSAGREPLSREPAGRADRDDGAAQRQREIALEQYRQAAAAHLDEVGRLREALAEQSTLVAELEDGLSLSGRRLTAALEEAERLRRHTVEIEEGDRARRSRLAEVEGTLLRLQRQTALAAAARAEGAAAERTAVEHSNGHAAPGSNGAIGAGEWERRLAAAHDDAERRVEAVQRQGQLSLADAERELGGLRDKVAALQDQLRDADGQRSDAERRWTDAVERTVGLERALAKAADDRAQARAETPGADVAGGDQPADDRAPLGIADGPRLEAAMREVSRLRETLERSEEHLWETKGQLLLDRERMAVLEHQLAEGPTEPTMTEAAHQSIMNAIYKELAALEYGVRAEIARIERIEKSIDPGRGDDSEAPAAGGGPPFAPVE
jgi:SAM-dependent methyltransferase